MERDKKFYELDRMQRLTLLSQESMLTQAEIDALSGKTGLSADIADHMIENVVGIFSLPLGIARNFLINGREVLVPMAIEEPSVVAAASHMAKLARAGGGFRAVASPPEMIGQMQVLDVPNLEKAKSALDDEKEYLLQEAGKADPVLNELSGGARDLTVRLIPESPIGPFLVIHIIMDVRDAMGANAVNTAMERIASDVERITGGRVLLRILSNLADRRLAHATCTIPVEALAFGDYSGEEVRNQIIEAWAFAAVDPHRAATHNKGIMNGVDAVVIASGNDWRAVEAGAHAYAARNGRYTSLSTWSKGEKGDLVGELEMPLAVGTVGGATRVHPTAGAVLKLMNVKSAGELAEIIVSVGLAQNLGALRALSTEGIQRGHMTLHARQIAASAGAPPEWINPIAEQMISEGRIHVNRAFEILKDWSRK